MNPPRTSVDPVLGGLVGVLAFPWCVHLGVVGGSALGFPVLKGRGAALCILALSAVSSVAAGMHAARRGPAWAEPTGEVVGETALRALRLMKIAAGLALATSLATGVLLPVIAYDSLSYRLPTIAGWFDAGRVVWVAADDPVRNGYPMGHEAVGACLIAAFQSFRWATSPSTFFVLGGVLALYHAVRSTGIRQPFSELAAAAFALVPVVLLNAP